MAVAHSIYTKSKPFLHSLNRNRLQCRHQKIANMCINEEHNRVMHI